MAKANAHPKFGIGDVVKTRFAVKVPANGRGRPRTKTLFFLPGVQWEVAAVVAPEGSGRPRYKIRTGSQGDQVEKPEWMLKLVSKGKTEIIKE